MLDIVAECATTNDGFIESSPPLVGQNLGFFIEAPKRPADEVADLKPAIFQRANEPVDRPLPAECDDMPAGLEDAVRFLGEVQAGRQRVPLLTHEAQPVWRVCADGVHAGVGHQAHGFDAVAVDQGVSA